MTISHHGEYSFHDLLRGIWFARVSVMAGCVLALVGVLGFILMAVPHSRAQMLLAPAQSLRAEAAGTINTGAQAAFENAPQHNFERFQSVARGAAVASLLLRSKDIVEGLSADRAFRFERGQARWTPELLAEYIERRVSFAPVGETSMRRAEYTHPDAAFAVNFLQRLQTIADGVLRHAVRTQVNERITYLQHEMQKSFNPDHRRALTDLLLEQERMKMMVSIEQPYAAQVVEKPYSSARPVWPDKLLLVVVMGALGALIGFVVHEIRHAPLPPVRVPQPDLFAQEAEQARTKLKSMRRWMKTDTANDKPLTGRGKKASPAPPISGAAE